MVIWDLRTKVRKFFAHSYWLAANPLKQIGEIRAAIVTYRSDIPQFRSWNLPGVNLS